MKIIFVIILQILASLDIVKAQLVANGVNCNDVKAIINKHNELRRMIAGGKLSGLPKASNMKKIVWDDKLQSLAQSWANKMKFQHNPNRPDSRFSVGENIYMSSSTSSSNNPDWSAAIQSWFDEHKKYQYTQCCANFEATGHYTQVAWADTIYVGCGYSVFMKNNMKQKLYVCDYGPAGNVRGQYPYKTGNGCNNLCCADYCKSPYGSKCA